MSNMKPINVASAASGAAAYPGLRIPTLNLTPATKAGLDNLHAEADGDQFVREAVRPLETRVARARSQDFGEPRVIPTILRDVPGDVSSTEAASRVLALRRAEARLPRGTSAC